MDELYDCMKVLKIDYDVLLDMPTWKRRYFMEKERIRNREIDTQMMAQAPRGKGNTTRTVSGDELKNNIGKYQ
jgi:hypothetical protein